MNDVLTETLTLRLSRRFAAAPERVFDAWLSPAWADWLPPASAECTVRAMQPSVGGGFALTMTMPDGRVVEIEGRYHRIERPHVLVMSWLGRYNNKETTIALTFTPDGDGTLMTLTQTGFDSPDLQAGYDKGWSGPNGSFDKLARVLAGSGT